MFKMFSEGRPLNLGGEAAPLKFGGVWVGGRVGIQSESSPELRPKLGKTNSWEYLFSGKKKTA